MVGCTALLEPVNRAQRDERGGDGSCPEGKRAYAQYEKAYAAAYGWFHANVRWILRLLQSETS